MTRRARAILGVLLLMLTGCGAPAAPAASAQQECERERGVWRSGSCERSSGGGGY